LGFGSSAPRVHLNLFYFLNKRVSIISEIFGGFFVFKITN